MDEPDPQILSSARRGDTRAFEVLVRSYQADVWRLCLHITGNPAMADDVTQDAFVRIFRFLPRYRGDSKFSTWTFAIARNCALDELRRSKRRQALADRAHMQREVEHTEQSSGVEVREAVASLQLELRESIVLIDMLGESYRDAARILDVPEGTVKSRVHRARLQLADMLGEKEAGRDEI
ncbi:MAG: eukaryotic-like serine/threonine-protein kinase [Actinomycetota bacterium]|nr:eukaryotic-like serine/threonine-protein kinase [Actinomycetota bacterium]